jgi:hypothetical protein
MIFGNPWLYFLKYSTIKVAIFFKKHGAILMHMSEKIAFIHRKRFDEDSGKDLMFAKLHLLSRYINHTEGLELCMMF